MGELPIQADVLLYSMIGLSRPHDVEITHLASPYLTPCWCHSIPYNEIDNDL